MQLSKDQVKKVAKLANLPITEEEEEIYTKQLSAVLDYIDQLNKVDTSGVDPIYSTSPNNNITQGDIPSKSLTQEQALQNSSNTKNGLFVTKGVFNEE